MMPRYDCCSVYCTVTVPTEHAAGVMVVSVPEWQGWGKLTKKQLLHHKELGIMALIKG